MGGARRRRRCQNRPVHALPTALAWPPTHARDAAYDLVLLAHVLAAVVGLGAVVVAGGYALALEPVGHRRPRRSGATTGPA